MALNAHTDPMTEAQREELKRLCDEADIPDRSGELLTRTGAQQMIDESQGCRASNAHTEASLREADVPDKSGELLTRTGAQRMIDELRHKAAEHRSNI